MRPDSAELADVLIEGLRMQGRDVLNLVPISSDMSYFAFSKEGLVGSAMVRDSHNPGEDNGIKLYRDGLVPVGLDSTLDAFRVAVIAGSYKKTTATAGEVSQKDITDD